MVRTWSVILGLGLIVLWIAGLSTPNTTGWLTWLDGVAAICSFLIAAGAGTAAIENRRAGGGPIALSVGLFALWIIGLATGAVSWLCWWTFAFACAYLIVGITGAARPRVVSTTTPVSESERDRFRRSA